MSGRVGTGGLVADFDFELPAELIAQQPPAERGKSRMLVMDRATGAVRDASFADFPSLLHAGDLLVLNDSRVIPARLYARRTVVRDRQEPSGLVEVLLTEPEGENRWRALVKPGKKVGVGERLAFASASGAVELEAEVLERGEFGERVLDFKPVDDFFAVLDRIGHMPLPPYIRRQDEDADRERYQTVFSRERGSVAAPTAGLHFTAHLLDALVAKGVEVQRVTLHVGLGTFAPLRVDRVDEVRLHCERYTLPAATAEAVNRAVSEGRRVVAVGTTVVRTLEHCALQAAFEKHKIGGEIGEKHPSGPEGPADFAGYMWGLKPPPPSAESPLQPHFGTTEIFISPGFEFRIVSGLLTNFHLPQSSLLMLVSAFAGRERVLEAYRHAVADRYRFFSYGDCMFLA